MNLTAEGLGPLNWRSWLNFYRTTFTGVAAQPAGVTVTSSGGGSASYIFPGPETVSIQIVTYDAAAQTLMVAATSDKQPDVNLTAEGFGPLNWRSWLNFYRTTFTGVAAQPADVTVTSSGGGSDNWNLEGTTTTVGSSTTISITTTTSTTSTTLFGG
ncbi:MAG: hypothetical protein C4530_22440 [Desulfobacteraceae bacterium]|nr:MAG: hypothetical protein C4530_22440 [Desulfobacteraceae bacterium]